MKNFRKSHVCTHMFTLKRPKGLVINRRQAGLHHLLCQQLLTSLLISPTLVEVAEPPIEKDIWRNLS